MSILMLVALIVGAIALIAGVVAAVAIGNRSNTR